MKSTFILIIFILLTIFTLTILVFFGDSLELCFINLDYKLLEGGFMLCICSYFAMYWDHGKVFSNDF